ncbi:myelin-oligodendrocyte glycoprotein-like [Centropristis striata]|uniref:myelin-oligodendrocyte glycoprotein-like n=1 Tax=Centropristis striata TaxID=184440 RepID=UPI0027E12701|nr:myelin-oligodendrocyte glycoprotein-like [Centropristis striata]
MIWTLVTVLSFLQFAGGKLRSHSGGFRPICVENITAVEGDPVTLQYRLEQPIDLSAVTVDVTRLDLDASDNVVHVYRHGRDDPGPQMSEYRRRTTLDHADLMRGNVTLQISSVNLSDSGRYRVFIPTLKARCTTELIVEPMKRHISSTTRPPPGDEGTKSGDQDVGNVKAVVIPIVVFILLCLFLCVGLLKRERIRKLWKQNLSPAESCLQRLRGRREQEGAKEGNVSEGFPLRTSPAGDHPDLNGNSVQPAETCMHLAGA